MKQSDKWYEFYKNELVPVARELEQYYELDKIKYNAVYVWSKPIDPDSDGDDAWGENVFDIWEDRIVYYVKDHVIPDEALPIIKKIQDKLKEFRLFMNAVDR